MRKIAVLLLLGLSVLISACTTETSMTSTVSTASLSTVSEYTTSILTSEQLLVGDAAVQKSIHEVLGYPKLGDAFVYYDYLDKAVRLDEIVFSFANNPNSFIPYYDSQDPGTWKKTGFWIDQSRLPDNYSPLINGYLERTFAMPTYLGDSRVYSSGSEPITIISMVLGSSYAGIDKSNQAFGANVYDFVKMTESGYDTGSKLVHNIGTQGQSFWYDIFPQIMFAKLYDLYPDTPYMAEMVINGADQWLEALPYFVSGDEVDYEFVGFNVVLKSPTTVGDHIEPPNGGLAFLFYSAYVLTGENKYLEGAMEVLDYFQDYAYNPNYEAMTDYAPFVAAALNYRYNTDYDIGKFLDFLFEEDSRFRPGWSVMSGSFGSHGVAGLVGQAGDYAFSMNSFHLASVLAPLVKYDARYAQAIGLYLLNVVNNAKVFFPETLPLGDQSMSTFLEYDLYTSICYEGFRNLNGGYATGDATTMFGQPSDLSLYSSAFIGALGGMVKETNQHAVLLYDLNLTDAYGMNDYPQFLAYNPYSDNRTIRFTGSLGAYDLFDKVTNTIFAKNVVGEINVQVPAEGALVLVVLPANSSFERIDNEIFVGEKKISEYQAAVDILNLASRQELTEASTILISYEAPDNDEVETMKIYFGEILAYEGVPVTEFSYDKDLLPDTDYELRIEITTSNGLGDYVTKRVVCR